MHQYLVKIGRATFRAIFSQAHLVTLFIIKRGFTLFTMHTEGAMRMRTGGGAGLDYPVFLLPTDQKFNRLIAS
jgi:hypothetical protein